jgi:hypothetical protein
VIGPLKIQGNTTERQRLFEIDCGDADLGMDRTPMYIHSQPLMPKPK